jgi:hypothetical protein
MIEDKTAIFFHLVLGNQQLWKDSQEGAGGKVVCWLLTGKDFTQHTSFSLPLLSLAMPSDSFSNSGNRMARE